MTAATDNRRYWVITETNELGPWSRAELEAALERREIAPTDQVRTTTGAILGTAEAVVHRRRTSGPLPAIRPTTPIVVEPEPTGLAWHLPAALAAAVLAVACVLWWPDDGPGDDQIVHRARSSLDRSPERPLAPLMVTPPEATISIGTGTAVLTITRREDLDRPLRLAITASGDAQANLDFDPLPRGIELPAGVAQQDLLLRARNHAQRTYSRQLNLDFRAVDGAGALVSGCSVTIPAGPVGPLGPGFAGGTATAIPGRLAATAYAPGGAGIGYWDSDPEDDGGGGRPGDSVDITPASSRQAEGMAFLSRTRAGEWLLYDLTVAQAGTYRVHLRTLRPNLSAPPGEGLLSVLGVPGDLRLTIPAQTGWTTVDAGLLSFPAGPCRLRLDITDGFWSLAWIDLLPEAPAAGARTP